MNLRHLYEVTVGIVIYDEVSRIRRLVTSFEESSPDILIYWVFVLNHQDSEIRLLIKNFLNQLIPEAQCIENHVNNIAIARNLILKNCKTNWLYFTDPDIDHPPSSLKLLLSQTVHENNLEQIVGYGGPVHYKSTDFIIQKTYDFFANIMPHLPFSFLIQNHTYAKKVDHIPTCHMLINRNKAIEAGGFNPNYRLYGEDLEFTHRLSNLNLNFIFVPSAIVYHWQNISFFAHLLKMYRWGQVQISSTYDNLSQGVRWYRLLPGIMLLILMSSLVLLNSNLILQLFAVFMFFSIIFPGLAGILLTILAYASGEISQLFLLSQNKKNVKEQLAINLHYQQQDN